MVRSKTLCVGGVLLGFPLLMGSGALRTQPGDNLESVVVPDGPADFSAYRVDADVFGWNEDFTEVGCIGMELARDPTSEQTGEAFLLVFKTDSVEPIHNVHTLFLTQGPTPHNPLPLKDVRDYMWGIDVVFQKLWPKRPKRKWYPGAMRVEMVWEKVVAPHDACEPAVGFVLQMRGEKRFQPHQQLSDIRVSCSTLELTDNRTYWGKKDVAVVMPRFDLGSLNDHEHSFRYPVSARWNLARALNIVIRAPAVDPSVKAAKEVLSRYGRVTVESGVARSQVLRVADDLQILGARLAVDLGASTTEVVDGGPDIVFELGGVNTGGADARTHKASARLNSEADSTYVKDLRPPQGRRKKR